MAKRQVTVIVVEVLAMLTVVVALAGTPEGVLAEKGNTSTVTRTSVPSSSISAIWANDGGDKVTQDEVRATTNPASVVNSVWNGKTVSQFGAKNEVVSFNLVLEAARQTASKVTVTLSNLQGPGRSVIRTNQTRSATQLYDWTKTETELFLVRYLQIKGLSNNAYAGYGTGAIAEPQMPEKLRLPLVNGTYTGGWTDRPNHDKFYPDIAVPLELVPTFPIEASHNQSIWVDIYIPKTVAAGLYKGTVTVRESGSTTHQVPVVLTVRNFVLPDVPNSKTMLVSGYGDVAQRYTGEPYPPVGGPKDVLAKQVLANQRYIAHRHKISMIGDDADFSIGVGTTKPSSDYIPFLTGTAFTSARGYAGPGVGTGNNVYSIGTYGSWNWAKTQSGFQDATNAWEKWFEANSPTTERFVYLIDESSNFAQTQQWADWMKTNPGIGRKLKSMATVNPYDAVANVPSLNIPTSVFGAGLTAKWQSAVTKIVSTPGHEFFMYNGYRPGQGATHTDADGTDLRERSWGQYKMGVARWFFWEATYYNDNQTGSGQKDLFSEARTFGSANQTPDPSYGLKGSNGDGVLFYPGTDAVFPNSSYELGGPIASLRLKHWRRGIQDIDYIALAARKNPSAVKALVKKMVPLAMWELTVYDPNDPSYYRNVGPSWSSKPDDWEAARKALAHIIDGA